MRHITNSVIAGAARAIDRRRPGHAYRAGSEVHPYIARFGYKDTARAREAMRTLDDHYLSRYVALGGDVATLPAPSDEAMPGWNAWAIQARDYIAQYSGTADAIAPTIDTGGGTAVADAPEEVEYIDPAELREQIETARVECDRLLHVGILADWRKRREANPRRARTSIHEAGHLVAGIVAGFNVNGAMVRTDGSGFARVDERSNPMPNMSASAWVDGGGSAAERLAFGEMDWALQVTRGSTPGRLDGDLFIGGAKELRQTEGHLMRNWTRVLRIANELFDNCGREVSRERIVQLWNITPIGDCMAID